jgi:GDPmannose 4,6-dehydratase
MWQIMQHATPDDYVLATGETHTVREFIERSFAVVGRTIEWKGKGRDETGHDAKTGEELVAVDERYFRPTEVDVLHGDASKAKKVLGWSHRVSFADLVTDMVNSDIKALKKAVAAK